MKKPTGQFRGLFNLQFIEHQPPARGSRFRRLMRDLVGGIGNPTLYRFVPDERSPFSYTTSTGLTISPTIFDTDGATTPRLAWWVRGFAPMDWVPAAIIHDWLFECHHRGNDILGFRESNHLLGEMCRTLGVAEWKIRLIIRACNTFGRGLWDYHYAADGSPDYSRPI